MRVLIAEHQSKVRFALRVTLERQSGLTGVSEVVDLEELFSQVELKCPDLLLLDWELPDMEGEAALPALRRTCSRLFILALAGSEEGCQAALRAGADVSISKGDSPDRLLSAIGKYLSKSQERDMSRASGNSDALA